MKETIMRGVFLDGRFIPAIKNQMVFCGKQENLELKRYLLGCANLKVGSVIVNLSVILAFTQMSAVVVQTATERAVILILYH